MKLRILSPKGVPITLVALTTIYAIGNTFEIPRSSEEVVRVEQMAMAAPPRSGQILPLSEDVLAGRRVDDLERIFRVTSAKNYVELSEEIIDGSAILLNEGQRVEVVDFTKIYVPESFKDKSGYRGVLAGVTNTMKLRLIKLDVSVALVRIVEGDLTGAFFYIPTESMNPAADY